MEPVGGLGACNRVLRKERASHHSSDNQIVPFAQANNALERMGLEGMQDPGFLKHFNSKDFHIKNRQSSCPREGRPIIVHSPHKSTFRGHDLHLQ